MDPAEHFKPIFIAKSVDDLRNNREAREQLKKYKINLNIGQIEKQVEAAQ